jgi:hypothetical protein
MAAAGSPGWGGGPVPLRPLNFGDVLDGAFKLLARRWRTLLLIAAVFFVPVQLVVAFLQRNLFGGQSLLEVMGDPEAAAGAVQSSMFGGQQTLGFTISSLATALLLPFIAGAICKVVAASYLGEQLEAGPALRATGARWWALVASWVLVHLLELAPFIPAGVLLGIGAANESVPLLAIGGLLLLVGGLGSLAVMPLFVGTAPAVVTEELGPIAGMRRSAGLLRRRYWLVLGVAIVSGLLVSVLSSVLSFPSQIAILTLGMDQAWPIVGVFGIVVSVITTPFIAIVATLLYFDGRTRQEGFDLQVAAAELDRRAPGFDGQAGGGSGAGPG